MKISTLKAKSILVKSNLPASDYVANPYGGCTHQCRYCYACFMKRFTGHDEDWGTFLDVKEYESDKLPKFLTGKTILLSSVTDPYNPFEAKYHKSREVLERLRGTDAHIEILSKSDLMVRDLDLLRQIPDLSVGISLNTLDDGFRKDMEPGAPSVQRRLKALETLHDVGITTYLFVSPIFPYITDIRALIEAVNGHVDQICFENLNLRGAAKGEILDYIAEKYPQHLDGYKAIYLAVGSSKGTPAGCPGDDLKGVFTGVEFLRAVNLGKRPTIGKQVAVIGGGNVAMDAARCAKRLGAENVYIVYRRGMAELPARKEEVEHAEEEGIIFKTLCNPVAIHPDEDGFVHSMTCIEMELGEPDASGRRRPIEKPGSEFELDVDTVIMSLGTSPNPLIRSTTPGLETNKHGCIVTEGDEGKTSRDGVYAGGDAVTGAATVIKAMGAGKAAAKAMDEYIRNK